MQVIERSFRFDELDQAVAILLDELLFQIHEYHHHTSGCLR